MIDNYLYKTTLENRKAIMYNGLEQLKTTHHLKNLLFERVI